MSGKVVWLAMVRLGQQIGMLAGALGVAGALLAPAAWVRFGNAGLVGLAVMWMGCLVPGGVLALWGSRWGGLSETQQTLRLLLVGTALRVSLVLAVSLAVVRWLPELQVPEFFLGVSLLYLVALAVETRQVLELVGSTATRSRGQAY